MADEYGGHSEQPGQYPATAWSKFGLPVQDEGSGAPGTVGVDPSATAGPVVGSPVVGAPYASSQVAENRPTMPVTSGDTSSFSDDNPIHGSVFLSGGHAGNSPDETGAGMGHAGHFRHPNSNGPGGA